jgi:hypothetical protein
VTLLNACQRRSFVRRISRSEADKQAASLVRTLTLADYETKGDKIINADQYFYDLFKVLEACHAVTSLSLVGLAMSTLVLSQVIDCIGKLCHLSYLHIAPTSPAGDGFRRLLDAAPGLRFLVLERVFLSRAPPTSLPTLGVTHQFLESISLHDQRYTCDYARLLEGTPLRKLRLRNMDQVACVIEAVAPTLERLEVIGLEDDTLTAAAVRGCCRLKALEIESDCWTTGGDSSGAARLPTNLRAALESLPPSLLTLSLKCKRASVERRTWVKLLKNKAWCPSLRYLVIETDAKGEIENDDSEPVIMQDMCIARGIKLPGGRAGI